MTYRTPRPHSLFDFRMEGVSYQLIELKPGEHIERKAMVAGYFYHIYKGQLEISSSNGSFQLNLRDTAMVGGFIDHRLRNESTEVVEFLVGSEPHEFVAWMRSAPIITIIYAANKHPTEG